MAGSRVTLAGIQYIANQLIQLHLTHGAVGTGESDVTGAETRLEMETHRAAVVKHLRSGSRIQSRVYFTNANLPTTVEEVGSIMDGMDGLNTGTLLTRSSLNFTKSAGDLLLIFELDIIEA